MYWAHCAVVFAIAQLSCYLIMPSFRGEGCPVPPCHAPSYSHAYRWNDVMAMGHGLWVMWVMGKLCDGSHGSWVTKDDPFPSMSPAFDETKSGKLWSTNCLKLGIHVNFDPLKRTYLGDNISARRGCCVLKFLHALEIDNAMLRRTQLGRGSPSPKF